MANKRYRLSGEDIKFINQLKGTTEPVYEIVNGREQYRPMLTDEELCALQKFREGRLNLFLNSIKWIIETLPEKDREDIGEFEISVVCKHKKKRYIVTREY